MLRPAIAISAAMIARAAWQAVRPLPNTAAADMVLFGRLAERRLPFHYVDSPLMRYRMPVSYTHLTLPTICSV